MSDCTKRIGWVEVGVGEWKGLKASVVLGYMSLRNQGWRGCGLCETI